MQSLLPAGWLAFTGRELNPLDRYKRFQITFSSPFSGFILAQGKFHFELPTNGSLIPTAGPRYGRHRIGPPIGRGGQEPCGGPVPFGTVEMDYRSEAREGIREHGLFAVWIDLDQRSTEALSDVPHGNGGKSLLPPEPGHRSFRMFELKNILRTAALSTRPFQFDTLIGSHRRQLGALRTPAIRQLDSYRLAMSGSKLTFSY